ncbi:MAG: hypothetical protein DRH56_10285, partial [Deltaproteobacteria bacterium]
HPVGTFQSRQDFRQTRIKRDNPFHRLPDAYFFTRIIDNNNRAAGNISNSIGFTVPSGRQNNWKNSKDYYRKE